MARQIMVTGVRKVEIMEISEEFSLNQNEVLVKTLYSGISSGTEMTIFRGTSPFYDKKYDPEYKLFLKSKTESWKYPVSLGYENVGKIIDVGRDVKEMKKGDIIFASQPHVSMYKLPENDIISLPEGIESKHGVFIALLGVAYNAILDAQILPGENVAVFGMGVIGQLIIQLARIAGTSRIIAVDMVESRLKKARISGADALLNPKEIEDIALEIRKMTSNRGADVVIETSGSTSALNEAIRTACFQGRVIVVSFLAGEAKGLYLGDEFHHNRIKLISSQASGVNPNLHPRWDQKRKIETAVTFLSELKLEHLISHEFKVDDAQKAYDLVDSSPHETMQVIFKY